MTAACAGPSREEVLEPLVGEDIEVAIRAFGQPAETVELDDGRRAYVWRRVYKYDRGRGGRSWPDRRVEGWTDDPDSPADARICSTRLLTDFELRIEAWDYGCETVIVSGRRSGDDPAPGAGDGAPEAASPGPVGPAEAPGSDPG